MKPFILIGLIALILATAAAIPAETDIQKQIDILKAEVEKLEKQIQEFQTPQWVTVTAFTATVEECGVDPNITASMVPIRPGIVAVSRDLFYQYGWTFGKKLYIENVGVYQIGCLMGKHKKMSLDIFIGHKEKAIQFGKRRTRACLIGG
jgi:3D (Asp-Asp-Asp) domain-containing protein